MSHPKPHRLVPASGRDQPVSVAYLSRSKQSPGGIDISTIDEQLTTGSAASTPLAGFSLAISTVHDFATLEQDLAELGFTVAERVDENPPAIEERLVGFADGSAIEFQAFGPASEAIRASQFWHLHEVGPGLVGYALAVSAVDTVAEAYAAGGGAIGPVRQVDRRTARGEPWSIRVCAATRIGASPPLPILIELVAGPTARIPGGPARVHDNGATGICGALVVSGDPAQAADAFGALAGAWCTESNDLAGARVWRFGTRWIAFIGGDYSVEAAEHLATKGPGLFEIALATDGVAVEPAAGRLLSLARCHGSRIRVA